MLNGEYQVLYYVSSLSLEMRFSGYSVRKLQKDERKIGCALYVGAFTIEFKTPWGEYKEAQSANAMRCPEKLKPHFVTQEERKLNPVWNASRVLLMLPDGVTTTGQEYTRHRISPNTFTLLSMLHKKYIYFSNLYCLWLYHVYAYTLELLYQQLSTKKPIKNYISSSFSYFKTEILFFGWHTLQNDKWSFCW